MGKFNKKSKIVGEKSNQNEEPSSESEENSDGDGVQDQKDEEEEIDVEFEAFGICDKDIDGIVALLKQAYAHENLDVRGVAEILANQEGRGCIFMTAIDDQQQEIADVKNDDYAAADDDDDEIYGVVSYIDFSEHQEKVCVKNFLSNLREKCKTATKNEQCKAILDQLATSAVWLINERLINLPYHIALPALRSLNQELEKSGRNFDHFVLISKINKSTVDQVIVDDQKVKKAKKRKSTSSSKAAASTDQQNDVIFLNAEEEFLSEECKLQFDYAVESGVDDDRSSILKPHRRVLIFDRSIFEKFLEKLERDIKNHCD